MRPPEAAIFVGKGLVTVLRCVTIAVAVALLVAPPLRAEPSVDITYAQPDVAEQNGNIVYYDRLGSEHPLTQGGRFVQPSLSPNGKMAAFIKVEVEGDPGYEVARTSLWTADIATRKSRKLLASDPSDEPTENLAAMWKPQFSLDGGFLYVMAEAWTTSSAIHQVNVKTGKHRFVIDGELLLVLQLGAYRGYLVVQRHRYPSDPEQGADNPVFIVRPDNKESFMVPGSDQDEGELSLPAWLKNNAR